ncbi:MAG: hypothetical protein HKO56_03405, partial [Bacteroidia bacterium]|nr:hypothetical protein [Bacteroidia bacterium]
MKKLFLLVIVFLGTILLFAPNKAEASHASAGYITYQYLSPNTYQLTLHFYRDCTGVSEPGSATVQYNSSCGGGGSITLPKAPGINGQPVEQSPCVPPVNTTCTGGSAYGVREWIYTGVVTLPIACADWTFSYSLCCRNPATTLVGSGNFYIETTLNSVAAPTNTSPSFSNIGISQFCVGSPVIWNQFATDPDNDSLAYTLVCPQINAGTSVNFVPPRSCLSPISAAPAVNLNAVTGQMTFTPNAAQVAVLAVKVSEYRGGVLIGSVTRDMQVNMVSNCTVIPFDNAWLGFNNNWDDPINWCKGVPTLTTSAVVRSVGGPGYVSPIIKNNIVAEAKSLKILNGDSVTINASTNGSLTMADSLINDSKLIVKGSFFGSEKFGPGNLVASAQF